MNKSNKTTSSKSLFLWREINWNRAYNFIRSKQNQLVIAVKRGDRNEVVRLQQQILPSLDGGALAVLRVVSNVVTHWNCHHQIHYLNL